MKRAVSTVNISFGGGVRSLLLGLAALLLLAAALTLIRLHRGESVATLPLLLELFAFAVVAPVLLVKGLLAGWHALRKETGGKAAVAGMLLNGALLLFQVVIAARAWLAFRRGI